MSVINEKRKPHHYAKKIKLSPPGKVFTVTFIMWDMLCGDIKGEERM